MNRRRKSEHLARCLEGKGGMGCKKFSAGANIKRKVHLPTFFAAGFFLLHSRISLSEAEKGRGERAAAKEEVGEMERGLKSVSRRAAEVKGRAILLFTSSPLAF